MPRRMPPTAPPPASSPAALARMVRQRRRDTGPELALRRELHGRGLRYRVNVPIIDKRRRHDIVFAGARVVVEVRGCYWHGCPTHGTRPKANSEWWAAKLGANEARDADTARRLREAGWSLIAVWEHEAPAVAAEKIERAVRRAHTKALEDYRLI